MNITYLNTDKTNDTIEELKNIPPLFICSNNLFTHINKNRHLYNDVITIVLHGLRDLFWMNRHMLSTYERFLLEVMMSGTKLPTFKNILEYETISEYSRS